MGEFNAEGSHCPVYDPKSATLYAKALLFLAVIRALHCSDNLLSWGCRMVVAALPHDQ